MKKTNKEIERIKYFIPKNYNGSEYGKKLITAEEAFISYSERGIKTPITEIDRPYYFRQLIEAKRWQGIVIHELWEHSIINADIGLYTILGGEEGDNILPRNIVDFLKKELFRGTWYDIIEEVYQRIINEKKYELS